MRTTEAELDAQVSLAAPARERPAVAAASVAVEPSRGTTWASVLRVWLPVVLVLLLLDVTFPLWFWRVPKLTPATADYGYQFLLDAHRLTTSPRAPGERQVLALGSSIASSFDPSQVRTLLQRALPDQPLSVDRLLLPGIKPSDLRLFLATDGAALRPDVAVVLLNPLDFLNPSFERDLKPQVRYILPPWDTLRERGAYMSTLADKLDLAVAGASNLYRYRKLLRASIEDHARYLWGRLRRAPATAGYGIHADGYTEQAFGVPITGESVDLDYYIAPEWIAQRGVVTLRFMTAAGVLAERVEREPGWRSLHVPLPADAGPVLHVAADSAWNPRAAGIGTDTRLLGVRLRSAAPPAAERAAAPLTYPPPPRHLDRLLRMGVAEGPELAARWEALLEADTEFGRRFRAYRDSKLAIRDVPVEPTGEYAELESLVRLLAARGTRVVIVNAPESALLRDAYENSPYYQSYLAFLAGLAQRVPGAEFHDLRASLAPTDFNDWHHATFIGTIRMGNAYAELVRAALQRGDATRSQ